MDWTDLQAGSKHSTPWLQFRSIAIVAALVLPLLDFGIVLAQADAVNVAYLRGKQPAAPDAFATLGVDAFGDQINLFSGTFSIEQTDFELPGNNALRVALVRQHSPGRKALVRGAAADWDLNTPRIGGTFAASTGWVPAVTSSPDTRTGFPRHFRYGTPATRCSEFNGLPDVAAGGYNAMDFSNYEYWQGTHMVIPGVGSQEVLLRGAGNSLEPTVGGPYRLVTRNYWQIGCLNTPLKRGEGQGLFAISSDGTRYDFDRMGERAQEFLRKGDAILNRMDYYLLATRVTDRFGNWVSYTYDPNAPFNLTAIDASDGRAVRLSCQSGRLATATDGTRIWSYTYSRNGDLSSVVQPDGSRWLFNLHGLIYNSYQAQDFVSAGCDVTPPAAGLLAQGKNASIVRPSTAE